ncbi:claudin-23 [Bombina bombina]|uniref:claudin-23 n=1 Tax=Bombina bombina TaxID=8345 RepID=UPI00235AA355|nr:claudin-23 [Bombina bombina]
MRTPVVMIIGMVFAPCGLVLNLTSTVAPNWRVLSQLTGKPSDAVLNQGIWDICQQNVVSNSLSCGQQDTNNYFSLQVVQIARGLMISSLVVTALGIVVASLGVRCWQDVPHYLLSGLGGLIILISGVLSLIAISWYNNKMYSLFDSEKDLTIQVGYSLVLGYLGSCLEILGGFSLALSLVHCCQKWSENKGTSSAKYYSKKASSIQMANKPSSAYPSTVYNIRDHASHLDHSSTNMGYSIGNDNYRHGNGSRYAHSSPRSYTNPMDVTEGERSRGRPESQLSSLPCDSDLL